MWGRSKPKEEPKSGFMGDTSPEQDAVLATFKQWVEAEKVADLALYDDYDMLRFCRARKFVLEDMQLMFKNFIDWRIKEGVDTIIKDYAFEEKEKIQEVYPHGYHGVDKFHRPIYIERIGMLDVPAVFTISTEERMIKHYIKEYEVLMKLRFPACSELAGKKIQQGLTIMDLTHGSIGTINK